jgi:hypothetical protein
MWAVERWYAGEGWRVIAFFKSAAAASNAARHMLTKKCPVRVVYV